MHLQIHARTFLFLYVKNKIQRSVCVRVCVLVSVRECPTHPHTHTPLASCLRTLHLIVEPGVFGGSRIVTTAGATIAAAIRVAAATAFVRSLRATITAAVAAAATTAISATVTTAVAAVAAAEGSVAPGATAAAAGRLAPAQQLGRYLLLGFLQDVDQLARLLALGHREEGVRHAGCVRAPGTSDTVHVIFRLLRIVIVDDHLDTVHVCRDIAVTHEREGEKRTEIRRKKNSVRFLLVLRGLCSFW